MLVLTVRPGDYITIGSEIVVQVVQSGDSFRLAIDAPRSVRIERSKNRDAAGNTPECILRVREKSKRK